MPGEFFKVAKRFVSGKLMVPYGDAEVARVPSGVVDAGTAEAVVVVVESRPSPAMVHLTCQATKAGRVRTWHHLSLSTRPLASTSG